MSDRSSPETTPAPVPSGELPDINAAVEVRGVQWPASAPTRVEDVADGHVTVARPRRAGRTLVTTRAGDELALRWTSSAGLHETVGTVTALGETPVPTTTLAVTQAPRRIQRREGFRVALALAAQLTLSDGRSGIARVDDLSEGGLRCTPPEDPHPGVGEEVTIRFELPTASITATAEVIRKGHDGALGLRFLDLGERQAGQVRAYLFSEQAARRGSPEPR